MPLRADLLTGNLDRGAEWVDERLESMNTLLQDENFRLNLYMKGLKRVDRALELSIKYKSLCCI